MSSGTRVGRGAAVGGEVEALVGAGGGGAVVVPDGGPGPQAARRALMRRKKRTISCRLPFIMDSSAVAAR
jgi:hypothetical protein